MKAGGNGKFRLFLELQDDYDPNWTLQEKYNSKAAALFRDKVKKHTVDQKMYWAWHCLTVFMWHTTLFNFIGCNFSRGEGVVH